MSLPMTELAKGDVSHDENPQQIPPVEDNINDVGAKYSELADQMEFSPAAERKYLRRIDMVLMPVLFLSWGFQYTDKGILNSAAQFGLLQDLDLSQEVIVDGKPQVSLERFSYAVMVFYWGYFVGSKFVGCSIAIWGIVTISTAGVNSYAGLMVNRFFLGICECTPAPAFSLICSMWYRRDEQPLRLAIWYSASGLGSLIGGIAFYGVGHIHGSLHPWRYQYIILGSLTAVWGVIGACVLPDNPTTAKFLSSDERVLAVKRMRSSQTGIENTVFKLYHVKETFMDPKTFLLGLTAFTITLVNGAVSGFGSLIIGSFGFSSLDSVLLSGTPGGVGFVALIVVGVGLLYFPNQRANAFVFSSALVIAGCVMIWKSSWQNLGIPLAGFILLIFFAVAYVMLLALMTANTAGHTKKAITSGLVWSLTVISNAVGPLLVKTTEAKQHYPSLIEPTLAVLALGIVMIVSLRFYLSTENKRRDRNGTVTESGANETAFEDMTDWENPNFRYSW